MKKKLVLLFNDNAASTQLSEDEIKAVLEYLQNHVEPFKASRMKRDILNVLIRKSEVFEMVSDEVPFSSGENLEAYQRISD
mmetsp:Transcript_22338/g.34591  ORF Transcript_22338/g.34591 Transcript_22338/m.34591 type:complete len:81 (+) Transcript_22338:1119-1361(+)